MIELKDVTKNYKKVKAVDNLSLQIKTGEIVGLLGPNGAGKSTTMKIVSGYLIPDEGEVKVDDVNVIEEPVKAKAMIGYMPENNPLYKDMLVKDAISYTLELHTIPKEQHKERTDYVVKATGLEDVYYRPISELSKGYKQRVGLAQVLVHNPKVLILDEPTEGLDPNQRSEIRNLIKDLGKDRTVIISTHVMQEVEAMCSRIIIINKGKIIKDGSKEDFSKDKEGLFHVNLKLKSDQKLKASDLSIKDSDFEVKNTKKDLIEYGIKVKNYDKFTQDLSMLTKNKNIVIYELISQQTSLEDIFRELTANN